jgi:sugar O-acyltransferase (sialic acid O-acetyltransferase NeuD family)
VSGEIGMTKIVILGTGGTCIDILDTIQDLNACSSEPVFQCLGFLDDNPDVLGRVIHGVPVLGRLADAGGLADALFVNGIGGPTTYFRKAEIIARTGLPDTAFATIVHPTAHVSRMARLGPGTVVLQSAVIGSNVRTGRHCIVLPLSVLSHDTVLDDYSIVAGGVCVSGNVRIGAECYIGAGSTIRDGLTIGDRALCGMGSVVVRDVPARAVVAGNPAKAIRVLAP